MLKLATLKFGPPATDAEGFKINKFGAIKPAPPIRTGISALRLPCAEAVPVTVVTSVNCNGSRYAARKIFSNTI